MKNSFQIAVMLVDRKIYPVEAAIAVQATRVLGVSYYGGETFYVISPGHLIWQCS